MRVVSRFVLDKCDIFRENEDEFYDSSNDDACSQEKLV